MRLFIRSVRIILVMIFILGCSLLPNGKFDCGFIDGNHYLNEFFNFKIPKTSGWELLLNQYIDKRNVKGKGLNQTAIDVYTKSPKEMADENFALVKEAMKNSERFVSKHKILQHNFLNLSNRKHLKFISFTGINLKKIKKFKNMKELADLYKKDVMQNPGLTMITDKTMMIAQKEYLYHEYSDSLTKTVCLDTITKGFNLQIRFSYKNQKDLRKYIELISQMEFFEK